MADWKGLKNTAIRAMGGYTQVWVLGAHPGHLSTQAPLCWEQKYDSKENQPIVPEIWDEHH